MHLLFLSFPKPGGLTRFFDTSNTPNVIVLHTFFDTLFDILLKNRMDVYQMTGEDWTRTYNIYNVTNFFFYFFKTYLVIKHHGRISDGRGRMGKDESAPEMGSREAKTGEREEIWG